MIYHVFDLIITGSMYPRDGSTYLLVYQLILVLSPLGSMRDKSDELLGCLVQS